VTGRGCPPNSLHIDMINHLPVAVQMPKIPYTPGPMSALRAYLDLLLRYLRPQRGAVLLLAALVLGGIGLQLANPQLIRRFLDAAEQGRSLDTLLWIGALFMAIAFVAQGLRVAGAYVGENVAWRATNALRADLALHCLRLDMSFHKRHKPGELIERVDGDVNLLANFFSRLFVELASNLILMAGVVVLLWLVDWRVGLSLLVLVLLGMAILRWINRIVVRRWQRVRAVEADLFGYIEEWLDGAEALQTSRGGPYVLERLAGLSRARWRSNVSAAHANMGVMSLPLALPGLAYFMAYFWGERLFRSDTLTIGTLYLIFYYIGLLIGPLWSVQRNVQDLQRAAASLNRVLGLFDEQPGIVEGSGVALPGGPLAVRFDGVSFHYEDDPPEALVLRDVSFTLAPGRVLGLLGRTGSGKTTLTRLLVRFYDPVAGSIQIGGQGSGIGEEQRLVDLREVGAAALRARVGMVTQDVQLFHASLRDNLTLFDDNVDDARLVTALEALGLRSWLESLPQGLDTPLAAGESLSAGEAQLLALARVFLADAGLVILDEASSRLDPATERLLEQALDRLLEGRTAIIIAHRLATVERAGEIMIVENGRVIEHGEHDPLVADPNSRFAQLLQVGLEEALA
jgi:ATP-binding cassette, subfamily B, bacterial